MIALHFAFPEKCRDIWKEFEEKKFSVEKKSMNDFQPLERVSKNPKKNPRPS